jgi:REP element-mobilizing transposase RayT
LVRSLSVQPTEETPFEGADDDDADVDVTPLADILGIVPSPKPQQDARLTPALYSPESAPVQPLANLQTPHFSHETSPVMRLSAGIETETSQEEIARDLELEQPPEWQTETKKTSARKKKTGELADTRPRSVTDVARRIVMEPTSPAVYNLTYACLLIPRFVHHYMTGDLRDKLSKWIPQISVAYGWRLEHILIRPDYIQWNLNVPPATSPGYLMRVFRQQLSDKIFADFPRLKAENPSGDFWAPGYLIMGGSQPPPDRLIREFIEQTRARQGLS